MQNPLMPALAFKISLLLGSLPDERQTPALTARIESLLEEIRRLEHARPLLAIARGLAWSAIIALFSIALLVVGGPLAGLVAALLLAVLALFPQERPLLAAWERTRAEFAQLSASHQFMLRDADHVSGPISLLLIGGVRERELSLVSIAPQVGRLLAFLGPLALALAAGAASIGSGSPLLIAIASLSILALFVAALLREGRAVEESLLYRLLGAAREPARASIELQGRLDELAGELERLVTEAGAERDPRIDELDEGLAMIIAKDRKEGRR